MRADRYTEKSQEALAAATREASDRGQQAVEPDHLLLALLEQEGGLARPLLRSAGMTQADLRPVLVSALERLPRVAGGGEPYASPALRQVLAQAENEADQLKDEYISTEHLLLAMARLPALADAGVTREGLLRALRTVRGNQRVTDANPESKYQALEKYGRDLTALAAADRLDPVIGRDEEIRRVIQVLSRRTKNNPVLIGEPGVGKTAIAEGL
ncbi:MAG: type VI secretion system ATPase TssH, partial [Candidatus Dormibacteraeota bacterium]|nr:type VI secretion system ATPase TssH [Candidatus Dormibacteraeota bacterium]